MLSRCRIVGDVWRCRSISKVTVLGQGSGSSQVRGTNVHYLLSCIVAATRLDIPTKASTVGNRRQERVQVRLFRVTQIDVLVTSVVIRRAERSDARSESGTKTTSRLLGGITISASKCRTRRAIPSAGAAVRRSVDTAPRTEFLLFLMTCLDLHQYLLAVPSTTASGCCRHGCCVRARTKEALGLGVLLSNASWYSVDLVTHIQQHRSFLLTSIERSACQFTSSKCLAKGLGAILERSTASRGSDGPGADGVLFQPRRWLEEAVSKGAEHDEEASEDREDGHCDPKREELVVAVCKREAT